MMPAKCILVRGDILHTVTACAYTSLLELICSWVYQRVSECAPIWKSQRALLHHQLFLIDTNEIKWRANMTFTEVCCFSDIYPEKMCSNAQHFWKKLLSNLSWFKRSALSTLFFTLTVITCVSIFPNISALNTFSCHGLCIRCKKILMV